MPLNIFDGSSWNPFKKIQIHDGSTWNEAKAAYVWDGTEWKRFSEGIPKNITVPLLSSSTSRSNSLYTLEPNDVLSSDNGTWENSPTSYKYQWYKKALSGGSWEAISGKTTSTITLTEDTLPTLKYVGYTLRCGIIATNYVGDSEEVFSVESGYVLPSKITSFNITVLSNNIVQVEWQKSIGATDYYLQYQGPEVAFTEIVSLKNNTNTKVAYTAAQATTERIVIDLDDADGTLGFLINPISGSGNSKLTGYGLNGSVNNLKINPAAVTSSSSNITIFGFTFNWAYANGIVPSQWILYNGSEVIASSVMSGLNVNSVSVERFATGGETYGSYYIQVTGTASRHKQTQWSSTPTLSITAPQVPTPVNTGAPVVSSSNGRVFACTTGDWTNSNSISSYIYDWKSNGQALSFVGGQTLNLGTNTQYDGTQISCNVSIITTDLRTFNASASNSVTAAAYVVPGPDPQIGTVSITHSMATSTSGLLTGSVSSSTGTVTWSWSNGTNSSAYYWSSGDFGVNLTLTATATSNGKSVSSSASFQVPDPRQTYYIGTSVCETSITKVYYQSPAVTGPFLTNATTSYAIPNDTFGGSGIVSKTVYRSTYAAALTAAQQSVCEIGVVFAPPFFPPFFPPSFYTPPFAPPFFPPFFPPSFYSPPFAPPFFPPFFPPRFGYSSIILKKNIINIKSLSL
jgi:hypothetical protein